MSRELPKLPAVAEHGLEVADQYGMIWQFDGPTSSWIFRGTIESLPYASDKTNGLVKPFVYKRLRDLEASLAGGNKYELLKVFPGINSYWYFFTSSNHTIKLTPEGENRLRLEVNRPKIQALLSSKRCAGQKGIKGPIGPPGRDGISGQPEKSYRANFRTQRLSSTDTVTVIPIDAPVVVGIETPLSVRLYSDPLAIPLIDVRLSIADGHIFVEKQFEPFEVDLTRTTLSWDGSRITGSICFRPSDTIGVWYYKVGQVGPKGPRGPAGRAFIEVISNDIDDPYFIARDACVSTRLAPTKDVLYFTRASMVGSNCVSSLGIKNLCSVAKTENIDDLIAVQQTTSQCKNIAVWDSNKGVDVTRIIAPELNLAEWTPVGACTQQRNWPSGEFNWAQYTNIDASNFGWQKANQTQAISPKLPWAIKTQSAPGNRCCQEDFFICPNINDAPADIWDWDWDPWMYVPSIPACCDCDCPIELDLIGGYTFPDVVITEDGVARPGSEPRVSASPCNMVECTINGSIHEYRQRVILRAGVETKISVQFKSDFTDLCNETRQAQSQSQAQSAAVKQFGEDCRPVKRRCDCPYRWSARVVSSGDNAAQAAVLNSPDTQVAYNGETVIFEFTGTGGIFDFTILVNLDREDCCLGYGVEICGDATPTGIVSASPSASPSPSPSPSPSSNIVMLGDAGLSDACGNCPDLSDAKLEIFISGIKLLNGQSSGLDGTYICNSLIVNGRCLQRGAPVPSRISTTGFLTAIATYDSGKLIVTLTECDKNGFPVRLGKVGLTWQTECDCDQLAAGVSIIGANNGPISIMSGRNVSCVVRSL